jgi:hypothetical protein
MRKPEIAFASAPLLGTRVEIDGLTYELVRADPYIRVSDGRPTYVLTWRGCCARCGGLFDVKTGLRAQTINKRCRTHRAPGRPATAAAKIRWARPKSGPTGR